MLKRVKCTFIYNWNKHFINFFLFLIIRLSCITLGQKKKKKYVKRNAKYSVGCYFPTVGIHF